MVSITLLLSYIKKHIITLLCLFIDNVLHVTPNILSHENFLNKIYMLLYCLANKT